MGLCLLVHRQLSRPNKNAEEATQAKPKSIITKHTKGAIFAQQANGILPLII
jgi:hypothetical protein